MMHQQLRRSDKAVLVIDLSKRASFKCVLDEGKETNRKIKDVLRLISEAKKRGIPIYTFMEYHRPLLKRIRDAVNGYGPIFEKNYPSAFGELSGVKPLLHERLAALGIQNLFIAGYDISICVGATIQSATAHGYAVHTAPSLLFISSLAPNQVSKELLDYYHNERMLEPDFDSLLARLKK